MTFSRDNSSILRHFTIWNVLRLTDKKFIEYQNAKAQLSTTDANNRSGPIRGQAVLLGIAIDHSNCSQGIWSIYKRRPIPIYGLEQFQFTDSIEWFPEPGEY